MTIQISPELRTKLMACAQLSDIESKSGTKMEVLGAINTTEATEVSVRVTALDNPVEFYFPAYSLSSGRWLINGQGRAYLVADSCQQFRLKDRRGRGARIPPDGRVSLRPNQQMEGILVFPRFNEAHFALLVYGDERLLVFIPPPNWPPN